ncbi:MAG TPA: CPBP family intramembrane glutamic endopeptidase [Bacteroidota bacterium]|nr:CPBP family intramembrane glutamic endopeptidase [Bacteroidota bacterium]
MQKHHALPDSKPNQLVSIGAKVGALLAVFVCFALIEWVASLHLLSKTLPLPPSLAPGLTGLFEHHVWQFAIGMFAITVLSRGHLWSYGINSSTIRLSMAILVRFYGVALVIIVALVGIPLFETGNLPVYLKHLSRADMVGWIVFQWMVAAVADEILFHGLFQTLLAKYWPEKIVFRSFEIPIVVLFTTAAFAAGRTNVPVYGGDVLEYAFALAIGLYGGLVYYRTRSLLTPMLSQAFFYGLPFVVRFAYLTLVAR